MTGRVFHGFASDALVFFERLAANNDREWFQAHRAEYEGTLKAPTMALLQDLSAELAERDVPLKADPKTSVMRINRDIRFARDKSPYRTNIAAGLTRDGSRHSPGMLYVHFAPEGCFAGVGFYELERPELQAFRARIAADPVRWRRLETDLQKEGVLIVREGAAKRLPQGFDADLPDDIQDAIKLKFFIAKRPLDPADIVSDRLIDTIADFAETGLGLLRFGWSALSDVTAGDRRRSS